MFYMLNTEDIRSASKRAIENFELWARRLIDVQLVTRYGLNWYEHIENGNPIIKKKLCAHIKEMMHKDKLRCPRAVDTLFLDDIIVLLCREDLYKTFFKNALIGAFPQGKDEAKVFLSRLIPIRNKLNHSNHISNREAEQAICYSNDFIDSLKKYYKNEGSDKLYNVPMIIRVADSLGNEFKDTQITRNSTGRGHCVPNKDLDILTVGEPFYIEVNIDPSFDESLYSVKWLYNENWYSGNKLAIIPDESAIRIDFTFYCHVISNEHTWHRCGDVDDNVSITYKIIPPIH